MPNIQVAYIHVGEATFGQTDAGFHTSVYRQGCIVAERCHAFSAAIFAAAQALEFRDVARGPMEILSGEEFVDAIDDDGSYPAHIPARVCIPRRKFPEGFRPSAACKLVEDVLEVAIAAGVRPSVEGVVLAQRASGFAGVVIASPGITKAIVDKFNTEPSYDYDGANLSYQRALLNGAA